MIKAKLKKAYRGLCLVIIVMVCVVLTGAGMETGYGGLESNISTYSSTDSGQALINNSQEIVLEDLVSKDCILRINYNLKNADIGKVSVLQGYIGKMQLLGKELDNKIILEPSDKEYKQYFPCLSFEAYDWFDEEKNIGILSLVLTEESKLAFSQLQSINLYEQLPSYAIKNLNIGELSSIQNVELSNIYNLQDIIEILQCDVKLRQLDNTKK